MNNVSPNRKCAVLLKHLPASTEKSTIVSLSLGYSLEDVGYPGRSDASVEALNERLIKLFMSFCEKSFIATTFSGTIVQIDIGQDSAWIIGVAEFAGNDKDVETTLKEAGWQVLPTGCFCNLSRLITQSQ